MDRNFERALSLVLAHEGGYVDHPKDPGGATNKGITIGTFRRFINPSGTKDDLKRITNAQVAQVYRRQYWDVVKAGELPDGLDYAVFDFAVNSGPGRAARYLQACVGAVVDGKVGPGTLAAVRNHDAGEIVEALCDDRMDFLRTLSTWKTFGKGWSRRVVGVRTEALDMAKGGSQKPVRPVPASPASEVAPKPKPAPVPVQRSLWAALWAAVMKWLGRRPSGF